MLNVLAEQQLTPQKKPQRQPSVRMAKIITGHVLETTEHPKYNDSGSYVGQANDKRFNVLLENNWRRWCRW